MSTPRRSGWRARLLDDPAAGFAFLRATKGAILLTSLALILTASPILSTVWPRDRWERCETDAPEGAALESVQAYPSFIPFGQICTYHVPGSGVVSTSWPWWMQAWGYGWVIVLVALIALILFRAGIKAVWTSTR